MIGSSFYRDFGKMEADAAGGHPLSITTRSHSHNHNRRTCFCPANGRTVSQADRTKHSLRLAECILHPSLCTAFESYGHPVPRHAVSSQYFIDGLTDLFNSDLLLHSRCFPTRYEDTFIQSVNLPAPAPISSPFLQLSDSSH